MNNGEGGDHALRARHDQDRNGRGCRREESARGLGGTKTQRRRGILLHGARVGRGKGEAAERGGSESQNYCTENQADGRGMFRSLCLILIHTEAWTLIPRFLGRRRWVSGHGSFLVLTPTTGTAGAL